MTQVNDLVMMQKLVDVKYRQQQDSFARIIVQENRLRSALRQLDEHLAKSRTSANSSQKAIGADVIWQSWVGRKKRELNMQLAQVLAVKERHIAQVRKAYGKVIVANEILDLSKKNQTQKNARSELDRAITSMLFREH